METCERSTGQRNSCSESGRAASGAKRSSPVLSSNPDLPQLGHTRCKLTAQVYVAGRRAEKRRGKKP